MSARLTCLVSLTLIAWPLAVAPAPLPAAEHPNIVLIFTDDQGYGDVGCYGAEGFKTPNLDRMAEQGMRFTDFYVGCPVCSGSRTALLTGCHYPRLSMAAVLFPGSKTGLNPDEVTIAEVLKPLGYATACIGKWHLGHLPPFLPTRQGFDYYFGIPYSNDMTIDPAAELAPDVALREGWTRERIKAEKPVRNKVPLMRGEEVIDYPVDQATLTRRYTEEAIGFIREHRDEPFFVYIPHTMCHYPLHASAKFTGRSERGLFGDVIEELDWSVGQILRTLEELKLDDKTLVIFTTDNGAAPGSSKPLRAKKGSLYDGGIRVPCIMRWPGKVPAGKVCSEVAATIDMLPTIAHLTGGKVPDDRTIDGKNIWPLMQGLPGAKSPHEAYIVVHGGKAAVRSGPWKFYPWPESAGRRRRGQPAQPKPNEPPVQLYDIASDIGETDNVAEKHPEVVARLKKLAAAHQEDLRQNRRPAGRVEEGFVSMFNGKDLTGWEGKPGGWWVEDGMLMSQSTKEKPCKKHHYLMWRGGTPGDFILRLSYRVVGGNSGIQIRSKEIADWDTRGYQADLEAGPEWSGALFEHARGKVAGRGTRVVIDPDGNRKETPFAKSAELQKKIKPNAFNDYEITARGSKITLKINGQLMCEADDRDRQHAAGKGVIALQMHPGPPMIVQFKNLRIKVLD